tara:strand:- start:899 stop:1195 length:297 start_codon:yes stop_codon:yes gene_type:complete
MISNYPLTEWETIDRYKYQGNYLILKSLKDNLNLKAIIKMCFHFCNLIHKRKLNNQAVYRSDHNLFISCFFALMKLKIIEEDDENGILIMPKKLNHLT